MHTTHWTDSTVGNRVAVSHEFNEQATSSRFNNQEWGLIMTATGFEIENADDPKTTRTVAGTEKVPQIIPELNNIHSQMGTMGGSGDDSSSGGSIVDSIEGALRVGGGGKKGEQEKLKAVERLAQECADTLQGHLEKKGKWNRVRISYLE